MMSYDKPPPLSDFSKKEYQELFTDFRGERIRGDHVLFEREGVPITKVDIMHAENEDGISSKVVAIFCNYLNTLQKIEPGKYNLNNKNRTFIIGVNVVSFDKFYKKAKYQLQFGFKNPYKNKPQNLIQDFDKLVIVYKYDNRWLVNTIDLRSHAYYIADFLSEDLSCVKYEELLDIAKSVASQEFGLPYGTHEFFDDTKINYLNDCGLYALNYVYKVSQNPHTESVRVKSTEKELFRR